MQPLACFQTSGLQTWESRFLFEATQFVVLISPAAGKGYASRVHSSSSISHSASPNREPFQTDPVCNHSPQPPRPTASLVGPPAPPTSPVPQCVLSRAAGPRPLLPKPFHVSQLRVPPVASRPSWPHHPLPCCSSLQLCLPQGLALAVPSAEHSSVHMLGVPSSAPMSPAWEANPALLASCTHCPHPYRSPFSILLLLLIYVFNLSS